DVVDDQRALVRRDDLADLILDSLEDLLGLLDAGAGRGADVKLDLPAINEREEVAPDIDVHHNAKGDDRDCDNRHDDLAGQQSEEELGIAVAQAIKTPLEAIVETREPPLFITVTFALQEQPYRDRRQGPGKAVGGKHRE